MSRLFEKINARIDYRNTYTLTKALNTLLREFKLGIEANNRAYAVEVINVTRKIQEVLSSTYKETMDYSETMSWPQKVFNKKIKSFIGYMAKELKSKFGESDNAVEIEQAIF